MHAGQGYSGGDERNQFSSFAFFVAVSLHLALVGIVFTMPLNAIKPLNLQTLSIEIVNNPLAEAQSIQTAPDTEKQLLNSPSQEFSRTKSSAVPIPHINDQHSNTAPNIRQGKPPDLEQADEIVPPKNHIPSRWALKPPLAQDRLESLGFEKFDIECLRSLEEDCQELRKEIFAEYQLTPTELVWTPNRADIGMTAEFRGLSHEQILEKLGMNYAGGNALVILPGITIDGPLWDKLHGVNKTCRLVSSVEPDQERAGEVARQGQRGVKRVCD